MLLSPAFDPCLVRSVTQLSSDYCYPFLCGLPLQFVCAASSHPVLGGHICSCHKLCLLDNITWQDGLIMTAHVTSRFWVSACAIPIRSVMRGMPCVVRWWRVCWFVCVRWWMGVAVAVCFMVMGCATLCVIADRGVLCRVCDSEWDVCSSLGQACVNVCTPCFARRWAEISYNTIIVMGVIGNLHYIMMN